MDFSKILSGNTVFEDESMIIVALRSNSGYNNTFFVFCSRWK